MPVEGQEIWDEWTGQAVEDTDWRRKIKGQWRAREHAVVRRKWRGARSKTQPRWTETRCMSEVEQGQRHGRMGALVAPCYIKVTLLLPFIVSQFINLFNKNDLHDKNVESDFAGNEEQVNKRRSQN